MIGRRDFISVLGGAAAWPLVARAQQAERVRRVAVIVGYVEGDSEAQSRISIFREALQQLGWSEGRNVRFDYRWTAGMLIARDLTLRNS